MKTIYILIFSLFSFMLVNAETTKTVGASGADYATLKLAFDAINDGTLQGDIILEIIASTTETSTAELDASATFTSLKIYPKASGLSVSGNFNNPIIKLNGADNVTIDGRVHPNGSTASLLISNTSTGSYSIAIWFSESAENNLVRYCNLQASCSNAGRGMIMFANANTGNGNDNNTIEYCNITNSGSRPIEAIFSSGSTGRENSGNIIRYNNIYNFFNPTSTSYGIHLSYRTTDWTITGNSFYETTTFSPAGAYKYYPIHINTGDNHIVSGNYIGGSAPECEGTTPFTINALVPYYFCAIFINGGTAGYIQDNEISNLDCTCSEDNPWDGIYINSGNVDVTGNMIGSGTGNNSIKVTIPIAVATATITGGEVTGLTLLYGGSGYTTTPTVTFSSAGSTTPATATATMSGGEITGLTLNTGGAGYTSTPRVIFDEQSNNYSTTHAIIQSSSDIVNITGNTIGSITTVGSDYYTHGFETVYLRGVSSTTTLSNNFIGSLTTPNSIHVSSAATNSLMKQDLFGIYSASNGTTVISGNTIANLTNAYAGINAGSRCRGIQAISGQNAILNNTVRDMKVSSGQSSTGAGSSLIGISQTSSSPGQTLSGNQVYNLSNLNTGDVKVDLYGIYFSGPASGTNTIDGNFVHSINIASANYLSAMMGFRLYGGNFTLSNNIVNIGKASTLGYRTIGIWDEIGLSECYFNTVYIGGSVSTASTGKTDNTAGLWNNSDNNPRDYRNNILVNARSGGTSGKHFAIRIAGLTNVTINYNDYYVSGTGGVLGQFSWQDKTDLAAWKLATSQDGNSLSIDPGFTSAGGTNSSDYVTSATLPAVFGTGITTDYDGIARANPPKMGALEAALSYVWQGNTSADFGTASNWGINAVPPNGSDISFAASPVNDCYLDQNRTLKNITNTSAKKINLNGNQLTFTGDIVSAMANQIDASSALSEIIFAGTAAQSIPSGAFVNNSLDALTLANSAGLTQNGAITVQTSITLSNGEYAIGANTLTINGSIDITSGTLTGGNSSDIVIGGSGLSTTLPGISLNNLTVNRANGISMGGSVSVAGTLALTDGTLTLGANTLTISGNSPTLTSGNIDASNSAATIAFTNTGSTITLPAAIFNSNTVNNFTVNGTKGVIAGSNITVNGELNLDLDGDAINPGSTIGCLDMSTDTLNMESAATTTGVGDVTGIVKREHTFSTNTEYSFGSQYTTFTFIDDNTPPTWMCVEISIGTVPNWTYSPTDPNGKIKRLYKLSCSDNNSTAQTNINMRYLLSELDATYNDESKLIFWHKFTTGSPHEHGKSNQDFVNHSIGVTGLTFGAAVTTDLEESQVTMAYSVLTKNTWFGGTNTDWSNGNNWSAGTVPDDEDDVLIPLLSGESPNYPSLTANAVASTIEIETGASITANSFNITVSGAGGAWINQGTFDPGTGKVLFDHGDTDEIVTIAGTTNFYDIEVGAITTFQPAHGSVLRIEHTGSADETSRVDFSAIDNTVEWNGADQDIVNPTGIGGNSGYYNLILSGSGTKTFSGDPMTIAGDFHITGTTTVTVAAQVDVVGNLSIDADATIDAGAYTYNIGGNITNNGTFNASVNNTIVTNGTSLQSIDGASTAEFYNLTIDNDAGVFFYKDVNVNQTLTLSNGNMIIGGNTLGINGTISQALGYIETTTLSSLSFGGSDLITLPDNLFTAAPTINNLVINRSGGVALGNQDITINGSLSLTDGDLDLLDNSLILAGTSPTRTSGSIDATDAASYIIFSNNDNDITLPASSFTGNISNLTINGLAGVTSLGDLTVDGVLSLSAANPSITAGSLDMKDGSVMKTLTMGATATTSGVGDVTGIIKRVHTFSPGTEYTFGNQFTTINFNAGGTTYPTALEVEVTIGGAPTWKSTAIERIYDFVQTGGTGCFANVATHYLETELNNNDENTLVQLTYSVPTTTLYEWGRSDASTTEKWVKISNVDIAEFPTAAGNLKNTLSASEVTTYTWDGSESSDWATLENWTPVGSPSDFSNVIIPNESNDPEIGFTGTASCNDLTLAESATLTLKSDATGTGSLIVEGTATGDVTVERFLTHDKWHYISGQTNFGLDNFDDLNMGLTGTVDHDQFYRWEESMETSGTPGTWVDILNGNGSGTLMDDEGFVGCKGYAINYITTDKTLILSGVPYSTNQSIAITKTTNSTNEGANLIGNPFTSTIALNDGADSDNNFIDDNSSLFDAILGGVYLWDEQPSYIGNRDDYNTVSNASGAEFAAPGQGFMIVKKDVGTSTVNFNANIRKHGTAPFFKNSNDDDTPRFKLFVKDAENRANTTTIAFLPNMTLGLDPSYDAGKLKGNPNIALYTRLVEDIGVDFAIQALPDNDIESIVIPVGIDVAESTLCEFSINSETMEGYPIYLQDAQENSVTNLKDHTYTTLVSESGTGRFFLHFKEVIGIDEHGKNNLQVWSSNSVIHIYNDENQLGDIMVVNMYGQSVHKSALNKNTNQQINLNVPAGYYIVSIVTKDGVLNKKVYL